MVNQDHTEGMTTVNLSTKLPQGVHEKHGRYYRVIQQNKLRQWIPLSQVAEGRAALDEQLKLLATLSIPLTIEALLRRFQKGGMTDLSPDTVYGYNRIIDITLVPVFGHMRIIDLRPNHVAQFLERGKQQNRAVAANRDRAVLSSAYEFGLRNGWVDVNPCRGIRRNKERPSRVYVRHEPYLEAYRRAPSAVQNLMHIGYLTGLRLSDLVRIRKDWITNSGIYIAESKTGHRRLIKMTPYLRRAIDRALESSPESSPLLLVANRSQPWTKWSVQSAWKRLSPGFSFRQIRAKAQTDGQGKNVLGHSGQMLQRYTRFEELDPVA